MNSPAAEGRPDREVRPVAWMESPHGALRANPEYRWELAPQTLEWALPLYTQTHIDGAVENERLRWLGRCKYLRGLCDVGDHDAVLERLREWMQHE